MTTMLSKVSPPITKMIRLDHTHVLATFHQYTLNKATKTRQALVKNISLALEIHAQLEEEIFYPEMRRLANGPVIEKSVPEHDEMRRLIKKLRESQPTDIRGDDYDKTVMDLMRDVMHHVADEETVLLPAAEKLLSNDKLCELGAQMTKRRLQLMAPHTGEIAISTLRSFSQSPMVILTGVLVTLGYLAMRTTR